MCQSETHILSVNINQLLFLSLIVGGDSLPRDTVAYLLIPILHTLFTLIFLLSIIIISLWSLKWKCYEGSIKLNENQITVVLHARGITSVMEKLYAKFIRIQNRHDLHCQTSEHSKVNLVHTGHGYWLLLVLLYLWLRQSHGVRKWVGMCVCLLVLVKICVHTHMHTF